MATKHLSNNEDDFKEIDELEDSEVSEMGEEGILTPKNPEEMELDDTELEGVPEPTETEEE
ncbi:MAG: hypothetical protein Q8N43_03235 [Candidatus Azambacteria bacterium]|nr:hypothetical protein [Candidatus Azambacteria bacterium]